MVSRHVHSCARDRNLDLRSTSAPGAHVRNGCCDALTVVLIGNSDGLAALGAVEHAAVDGDDVGRVAVDVATGTSITALS